MTAVATSYGYDRIYQLFSAAVSMAKSRD